MAEVKRRGTEDVEMIRGADKGSTRMGVAVEAALFLMDIIGLAVHSTLRIFRRFYIVRIQVSRW